MQIRTLFNKGGGGQKNWLKLEIDRKNDTKHVI